MKKLIFIIQCKLEILFCVFYGGHQFSGIGSGWESGCTRCLKFEHKPTTVKSILETFNKRQQAIEGK
jgi:hypothetical protein